MALLTIDHESYYMHTNALVTVLIPKQWGKTPQEIYSTRNKYKVLWLLHGAQEDATACVRKTNIEVYAQECKDLVVVMPSGGNSMYAETPTIPFESYFFEELVPMLRSWLPLSERKEDNFVAGMSMGGNGALKMALLHPEMFAAVACLSASAIHFEEQDDAELRRGGLLQLHGSLEGMVQSNDNTWRLTTETAKKENCPKLFLATGDQDKFIERIRYYRDYAQSVRMPMEYREYPGYVHEWRVWDIGLDEFLRWAGLNKMREER
ncbi:MAG: hypothetical protein IJ091_02300 [Oscillospiraceae bacterium]|nr:hypothetical protein [Oscillospiraceae bacterium]